MSLLRTPSTIRQFFFRALLLMPIVFAAWYILVPLLHWPIRGFLATMAHFGIPEFMVSITWFDRRSAV
jgi:hypothetical protein